MCVVMYQATCSVQEDQHGENDEIGDLLHKIFSTSSINTTATHGWMSVMGGCSICTFSAGVLLSR
jgi:hypothetical protein